MPRMDLFVQNRFLVGIGVLSAGLALSAIQKSHAQDQRLGGFLNIGIGSSAENLTLETDVATYSIKKIELLGTGLSNSDLAALFDPKAATSITDRFAKLTATEITIPELTVTTKAQPVEKTTYQNIKLSGVKQGKVAVADIGNVAITVTDAKGAVDNGNIGHIHAQGVDLVLASHIMNEARNDDSEALKTLYESFSIDGVKLNGGGDEPVSMTIANFTGRDFKARALAIRPSEFQAAASDQKRAATLIRDVFMSIEMEEFSASNMELHSINEGKPVAMSIGKMSLATFANAKIGNIRFEALDVNTQGVIVKIGDIGFKTIDFAKLRDLPAKAAPKADDTAESKDGAAFVPFISQFGMNKVTVSIPDDTSSAGDAKKGDTKKGAFSIDHFQIDGGMPVDSTPTQMTATLDHLVFDLGLLKDKDVRTFTDMGYSKLDLSSRIDMAWDASAEELTIKDVSIQGADMGGVKVSGLVDNVTRDFFSGDSAAMQAAAFGALVKRVEIRIDNAGLFEKATAAAAKAQNKSIDEIKKSYVAAAAIGLPAMLDNRPAAKIIGVALAKFVASPKSFHLVAVSADGLGAADFALTKEPASLLDALDIKATANE